MQHTQKKHFSEEEALDKMEGKIDALMEKVVKKSFIHRFIQWFLGNAFVKKVLNHSWVNEMEHKLQPYLKTIFMVVGWISIIT